MTPVVVDSSFGQHGIVLFQISLKLGIVSKDDQFALPCLIIFSVYLYPSTYFPLFIASWILELMDFRDFFHLLCSYHLLLSVWMALK